MADPDLHVFWHDDALLHDTGSGVFESPPSPLIEVSELHPENDVRIRNIRSCLREGPIAPRLAWRDGRHATIPELEMLHDPAYVEQVREFCEAGGGLLGGHTVVSAGTWPAALSSAGTAIAAVEAVLDGDCLRSYALVRPPGHHAQPARTDGYCMFSNTALAAETALRRGVERVAVLDWDVHHGNGTQECFYDRGDVLSCSLHMPHGSWGPAHPQTGSTLEAGIGDGAGYNVNIELAYGSGDTAYASAMQRVVTPILDHFRPGLILIAAGQDASQFDPNGRQCLTMAGFRRLGELARELADRHCDGRLALLQEGGYGRSYSALCMHATLEGVLATGRLLEDPMGLPARRRDPRRRRHRRRPRIDAALLDDLNVTTVRPLTEDDRSWLTSFMTDRWGVPVAAGGGRLHQLDDLPGFAAVSADGTVAGVVTYLIEADVCEVISIDSVVQGEGVGTALLEAACKAAVAAGCRRVQLITTNDNVDALRFYQRRGFALTELRPGAVGESRRMKPQIPATGAYGIPIRDELVLVRELR